MYRDKNRHWIVFLVIGTLLPLGAVASNVSEITVETVSSLGETHYKYTTDICSITAVTYNKKSPNSNVLSIQRDCSLDFVPQIGLVGLLLAKVELNGELQRIRTIYWGQILEDTVKRRLASFAMNSEIWSKVTENNSDLVLPKSIPEVVTLLNDCQCFVELVTITTAMGFTIQVSSVEGVLVDRVENIPELSAFSRFEETIVPYSASVWFSIAPISD